MINVKRLGHATLTTVDLVRDVDYYTNVIGLSCHSRSEDEAFLVSGLGQVSLHLKQGTSSSCVGTALEVAPDLELADCSRFLSGLGIGNSIQTDRFPGVAESLMFTDPKGTEITLFSLGDFFPDPRPKGVNPIKIGHLAFIVEDAAMLSKFYSETLGFRVSDWVNDFFVFMRCGPDHHTVNFLQSGGGSSIHHIAFELKDSAQLLTSCDILAYHGREIIWGPVRHGPGHNVATYHYGPNGIMIELFAELDRMSDEQLGYFDPRPWHEDKPQRPKVWIGTMRRDVWGPMSPPNFVTRG